MERPPLEAEAEAPNSNNKKAKALKMVCASMYLPKDNPFKPYGDDAHFICPDHDVIAVADGVGGWASHGVDAGDYARELMLNSATAVFIHSAEERSTSSPSSSIIDPARVLREAFTVTYLPGSSTACIVSHSGGVLRAANVGDSGFMLFRNNRLVHRSPTQQKAFNCPYQLGNAESSDRPDCADETELAVEAGDIVVLGTDGLLDNVFEEELETILENSSSSSLERILNSIADTAFRNSMNPAKESPFSEAAKRANVGYSGGKRDDITVIVGQIVMSST